MYESRLPLRNCNVFGKRNFARTRRDYPAHDRQFSRALVSGELLGPRNDQYEVAAGNVQQTIQQQAAGGKVVRVKREDDMSGRWNYEVTVKSNGKEWGFEVDPNGKLVKKHGETQH